MGKKICGECGAPRGTPHNDECSGAQARLARQAAKPTPGGAAILVSKTPLRKQDMAEGLAVSRGSGRVVYHTPRGDAPPGFEAPEAPIEVTDAQKLIDGTWSDLADKLDGGTVSYVDPAVEAGMREPTPDDWLLFCGPDGVPRMKMPLSVYNHFVELSQSAAVAEPSTGYDV